MSAWAKEATIQEGGLYGRDGRLVTIRLEVEARLLEQLLEALAELPYAINPQLRHEVGAKCLSVVEFPAYEGWVPSLRERLEGANRVEVVDFKVD